jgi:hypothetical protein
VSPITWMSRVVDRPSSRPWSSRSAVAVTGTVPATSQVWDAVAPSDGVPLTASSVSSPHATECCTLSAYGQHGRMFTVQSACWPTWAVELPWISGIDVDPRSMVLLLVTGLSEQPPNRPSMARRSSRLSRCGCLSRS